MKKYKAIILTTISASLLFTSCGKTEEEKIINDLDLEIEEFLENNPEFDLDKSGNEKDEDEVKTTEKEKEELAGSSETEAVEIKDKEENNTENNTEKNIKTVKTVEDFAKCITENGAKMFGTEWCGHCKTQKEMFGKALEFVSLTDCDTSRKICKDAGITGYPTWKIGGESFPGVQKFEFLGEKTGCKLEK